MISKKHFLGGMVIGLILLSSAIISLPDGKLHLVFCNVGQGDAAYIRAPNGQDMLIDGGPNDKVLSCLGKQMPFYDRTIDVVVLTHPQKDHLQGLLSVMERYNVKYFVTGVEGNESEGYKKLVSLMKEKKIPVKNLFTGDEFSLGEVRFRVLWPAKEWVASQLRIGNLGYLSDPSTSFRAGLGNLGNGVVLGVSTDTDLNAFSYFLHLQYKDFDALFTGDGDSKIQPKILDTVDLPDVELLKVPHHGSKTAMLGSFLDKIRPEEAVISVGRNPWGHPTEEALKLLDDRAIKIRRTDREGDVEIIK